MPETLCVHGLVVFELDDAFPWRNDWKALLADLVSPAEARGQRVRVEYHPTLSPAGRRPVGDGLFLRSDSVYDEVLGVELCAAEGYLSLRVSRPAIEWLYQSLQIALLRAGATLVHSAAIARDGRALVLPSWGGVGKTAIVAELVRRGEWTYLGDDLVIVTRDGRVLGFPKPMVLYPYHRSLFPEVFAKGRGPRAPIWMNEALGVAARTLKPLLRMNSHLLQLARRHNPQSSQVLPSTVFGAKALTPESQLGAVLWLERAPGLAAPTTVRDDPHTRSRIMGSTMTELPQRTLQTLHVAMGLGIVDAAGYYQGWADVLGVALAGRPCHALLLPADLPIGQVPRTVEEAARSLDVFAR